MGRRFAAPFVVLIWAWLFCLVAPSHAQTKSLPDVSTQKKKLEKKGLEYYFHSAKIATKNEEYQRSIRLLERAFDLDRATKATPVVVWELASINFEKMGNPKLALAHLFRGLKSHFSRSHDLAMEKYKADQNADDLDDLPELQLSLYFKLARNFVAIAMSENYVKKSSDEAIFAENEAKKFIEICLAKEYREKESEIIKESINNYALERERSIFTGRYFAGVGYLSWQDKLTLNAPDGSSTDLLATSEGPCMGGGYDKSSFYWGFKIEGCMSLATANVGENSRTVDYFQKGVPVTVFLISPGVYLRPFSGEVSIGIEMPLLSRSGQYSSPGGGFSLENTSILTIGGGLELRWFYSKIDFSARVTKFLGLPSVAWLAMGHYIF